MITRLSRFTAWSLVCTILLSLLLSNAVVAQTPGGGPDEAMAPPSGWVEIQANQTHWYAFSFDYDEGRANQPIEIKLYTEPVDGAVLTVRNEEQAQLWRSEGKNAHFGCCTSVNVDKDNNGQPDYALWSGALRSSGKYYIVVEHAKNLSQPVRYRYEVTGAGLSFPTTVAQPVLPVAAAPAPAQPLPSALPGSGPDFAQAPTDQWIELKSGQYHWYAFDFGYDAKRENPVIEIKLWSEPNRGAMLTLRNAEQANLWRKDGKHEWFGCTTPADVDRNSDGNPDYSQWAGALRVSGRYYMVVEHTKEFSQPVYYRFTVKGEGFSFPGVTAAPAPVAMAPAAAPVAVAPRMLTDLTGTGPDYAMRPTSEWTEIQSGQYHWYAFRFGYDEKRADQPITIRIYSEPNGGAILTVRNTDQADLWRRDGKHEHFGCCTLFFEDQDKDGKSDYALWSGALRESGTYYLVVEHARDVSGPVRYSFTIEGPGVSY